MTVLTFIFEQVKTMAWAVTFVIPVVLLCRCLLAKAPKKFSYLLWGIVALRLLCPVMISSEFSMFRYVDRVEERLKLPETLAEHLQSVLPGIVGTDKAAGAAGITDSAGMSEIAGTVGNDGIAGTVGNDGIAGKDGIAGNDGIAGAGTAENTGNSGIAGATLDKISDAGGLESSRNAENSQDTGHALLSENRTEEKIAVFKSLSLYIWLAGMTGMVCYAAVSWTILKRKLCYATKWQEGIYESDVVHSPFVFGIRKPVIYLPYHLSDTERAYILKHEQYHIKRRDYLVKWAAFLLLSVYWFHPLVWAAYFLMSHDMEMSCDEYVLGDSNELVQKEYSTLLLQFATEKRIYPVMTLTFGEKGIRQRISHILHYKKKTIWSAAGAVLLLTVIAVFCLTDAGKMAPGGGGALNEKSQMGEEKTDSTENGGAASETAGMLYDARNSYIGDASADGKLISAIFSANETDSALRSTELQTTVEPYVLTLHFDEQPDELLMWRNSILLLALIGNCGEVDYDYVAEDGSTIRYYVDVKAANENLEIKDIKEYGTSAEKVEELLNMLGNLSNKDKTKEQQETYYQNARSLHSEEIYTEKDFEKVKELLASLPDSYDEAMQRDDLLLESAKNTESTDYYQWDVFYDHVKKKTPASMIRAISTTEGDMLYTYVSYDGEKFYYVVDESRDKFRGDSPEYYEKTYKYIKLEERRINGKHFQEAILTNDENLTCEEYDNFWISSQAQPMPDASSLIFRELD